MIVDFKPMLTLNNKRGVNPDWNSRLQPINEWMWSEKLEGVRIEIDCRTGESYTRALKPIRNQYIQDTIFKIISESSLFGADVVLEGELFAGYGTFEALKGWVSKKGNVEPPKMLHDWGVYLFDMFDRRHPNLIKLERYKALKQFVFSNVSSKILYIPQYSFSSVKEVQTKCDQIIRSGGEGIMLVNARGIYKQNRTTEKERLAYKMKDDAVTYKAIVLEVEEGTVVSQYAETGVNELGYSTTSKKKDDRLPSGKAATLRCRVFIDDYSVEQSVSLSGFTDTAKKKMLKQKEDWKGKHIEVVGMKPTIPFGKARSAFYKK